MHSLSVYIQYRPRGRGSCAAYSTWYRERRPVESAERAGVCSGPGWAVADSPGGTGLVSCVHGRRTTDRGLRSGLGCEARPQGGGAERCYNLYLSIGKKKPFGPICDKTNTPPSDDWKEPRLV